MLIIPLAAVPSQIVNVNLANAIYQFNVYQKSTGLFLDLLQASSPIVLGALCRDRNLLIRDAYLGFPGDLAFIDSQGTTDPVYTGFGGRYALAYLSPSDLAQVTSMTA